MKIFQKIRELDGRRKIYFCGVCILSYHKRIKTPDFSYDIMKFMGVTHCRNLRNLVLGSSHGRDGFVPGKYDFNLSNSSLDLYRIWHLYKYVAKHNNKDLKNIIVFWSVFHPGLQLEKTREWTNCIPYKGLYGIEYASPLPMNDEFRINLIRQQAAGFVCPPDFRGLSNYRDGHNTKTDVLVQKHLKNTMRNNNQIKYMANIVKLARKKGHNIFVVLPPYRSDYLRCLPPDSVVYRELFEFLNKNQDVTLLNFQNESRFADSDFNSPDHCNEVGGRKLTKLIKNAIGD